MEPTNEDIEAQIELHRAAIEGLTKAYEEAVQAHHCAIAIQRRLLNSRLPVARLLPELLAEVFYHHVTAVWHRDEPDACFKISHVCHYWRSLMLQLPTLWKYATFPMSQLVPTMLARSQRVPLEMVVKRMKASADLPTFREMMKANSHRIRHLEMHLTCAEIDTLTDFKFTSLSLLRHLRLTAKDQADSNDQLELPSMFNTLNHQLHLESLTLEGFHKPWSSPIFCASLRHLFIVKPFEAAEGIEDLNLLMDVLANLPSLQTLSINNALPRLFLRQIEAPHSVHSVKFPNLTRLTVEDDILELAEFLAHVSIPSSADIKVGFEGKEVYWKGLPSLAISMSQFLVPTEDRPSFLTSFVVRTIRKDDKLNVYMDGYDKPIRMSSAEISSDSPPRITLGPIPLGKGITTEDVFGDFFAGLPLMHIRHLSVDDLLGMNGSGVLWDQVAKNLPNLQVLRLCGKSITVLPRLLVQSQPPQDSKPEGGSEMKEVPPPSPTQVPLLLPRLQSLVLDCSSSGDVDDDVREELCKSFRARRAAFTDSSFAFSNLTLLKQKDSTLSDGDRGLLQAVEEMCSQGGRYSCLPPDPDVPMKDDTGAQVSGAGALADPQMFSFDFSQH
ncbi:unnamed protein product [Somion occarium]|uniref:F-box domain-containing protein n=1 Tax=Somion occarium TaxID=3059160 RepID=A0ABP1CYI0_9APHY